jgi:hypothetical protein
LESTLVSVLENRPRDSEVLVVLNQPYADPYDIGQEVRLIGAPRRASLAACANLGFREARAPVVHLLAAGSTVADGWADIAMAHFRAAKIGCVAPLVVRSGQPDCGLALGVARTLGGHRQVVAHGSAGAKSPEVLGPTIAAGFYRRSVLEALGGFDPLVGDSMADVDLACSIRSLGLICLSEPRCRIEIAQLPVTRDGAFRQAVSAERFFWRTAAGAGWARGLVAHAAAVAGELTRGVADLSMLSRLAGRLWGFCDQGRSRRHYQRLCTLAKHWAEMPAPVRHETQRRRAA